VRLLLAARTRVTRFADESAVVIDRYDRRIVGDSIVRVHQEDLCQTMGIHPSRKYQNEGGPGPAEIAGLLRQVMGPHRCGLPVRGPNRRFAPGCTRAGVAGSGGSASGVFSAKARCRAWASG
jgi:hypothetical protein